MASNTEILIKRSPSTGNDAPSFLNQGELGFSYKSNTLFIGTEDSDSAIEIGHWSNLTNLIAGTYGDATNIPIITVDGHGTVTNVSTSVISTTLSLDSDSGSNSMSLLHGTLTITGGDGIATSIVANTSEIIIDVDHTVFRSNTEGTITGTQNVQSDVQISGNLTVQGTTTYVNTAIYATTDSLIELAANNTTGDVVDIGFYGLHQNTSTSGVDVTGLVRNAGTSDYYLFDRVNIGDETNIDANTLAQAFTSANGASLYASQFLASEGTGATGGFSFNGDGGLDTGMFSPTDGELHFYSNDQQIISANTDVVSFGRDLKLQSSGAINNPAESSGDGGAYATLELRPDTTLGTDQYIVIDPTVPNHIHLRAGGTIDSSSADLFLGAENNHVQVSDSGNFVSIKTDSSNTWTFGSNGILELPNGTTISDAGGSGLFVDSLNAAETSNIVFYNTDTKELTYGSMADLRPDRIQSGSYYWEVDASTGALFSDAGTYIGDNANSVVIGQNIDLTNTNTNRVAIGNGAGQTNQSYGTVAIGEGAGNSNQNFLSVAVGINAGNNNQNNSATAVGHGAGYNYQGTNAVAIGNLSGKDNQGNYALAAGSRAGYNNQGQYAVAMGYQAGQTYQGNGAVAIGDYAGNNYQSTDSIAIGTYAGENSSNSNGWAPIAIGRYAGQENAGSQSVAIGSYAGHNGLGYHAVAIGHYAANGGSGEYTVAIGDYAGYQGGYGAIAMGYESGSSAGNYSVALGYEAGWNDSTPLGAYQIAIGAYAAQNYGQDYSIVLNASGSDLSARSSGFFVNPVAYTAEQDSVNDGIMFYNQSTKEIRYSYTLDGGSF